MTPRLVSLHHVTATVDDAQGDLDFCLGVLGMHLVKKTVNFDNHGVYHFYYGNASGTPGTLWTTFPYKDKGVPVGEAGTGQVVTTSFSVPVGSLDAWRHRLASKSVPVNDAPARFGETGILFEDPSGVEIELVAVEDRRAGWTGEVDDDMAVRGLHSVTALVADPQPTIDFMAEALGCTVAGTSGSHTRIAIGRAAPGHYVELRHDPRARPFTNGLGTVHHVAVGIGSEEELLALQEHLAARGHKASRIFDRKYFKSLYFRLPGNIGFEVATMGPGFAVDEEPASLGRDLRVPLGEEANRAEIEAQLPAVVY